MSQSAIQSVSQIVNLSVNKPVSQEFTPSIPSSDTTEPLWVSNTAPTMIEVAAWCNSTAACCCGRLLHRVLWVLESLTRALGSRITRRLRQGLGRVIAQLRVDWRETPERVQALARQTPRFYAVPARLRTLQIERWDGCGLIGL